MPLVRSTHKSQTFSGSGKPQVRFFSILPRGDSKERTERKATLHPQQPRHGRKNYHNTTAWERTWGRSEKVGNHHIFIYTGQNKLLFLLSTIWPFVVTKAGSTWAASAEKKNLISLLLYFFCLWCFSHVISTFLSKSTTLFSWNWCFHFNSSHCTKSIQMTGTEHAAFTETEIQIKQRCRQKSLKYPKMKTNLRIPITGCLCQ